MLYDFDNIEHARIVGKSFRLLGLSASQVDGPLSEVDTLTLDGALARIERLEAALKYVLAEAEKSKQISNLN
jgi:hypothetical protein